jgi:dimethylargininase
MIAFLREVSARLDQCELMHVTRCAIDVERARWQHAEYARILGELGVERVWVPPLPAQPDGVFVEDTAVLLPELAAIARPGAVSRLPEVESIAAALAQYRPVERIGGVGTLEGGDVLRVDRALFVGRSQRTTAAGIAALAQIVESLGYEVRPIEISDCMHLKTACTFVPPHFLIVNAAWVQPAAFGSFTVIHVDETEPFAANTLTLAGTTLVSASCPKTERRLQAAGIGTRAIDISEFERAEGGLTCLSLVLAR